MATPTTYIIASTWEVRMRIGNYQVVRNVRITEWDSWAVRDARTGAICLQNSLGHAISTAKLWKLGDEKGTRPAPTGHYSGNEWVENGEQPAAIPARHTLMAAKFAGRCKVCGRGIQAGDTIAYASGWGAAHATCAGH